MKKISILLIFLLLILISCEDFLDTIFNDTPPENIEDYWSFKSVEHDDFKLVFNKYNDYASSSGAGIEIYYPGGFVQIGTTEDGDPIGYFITYDEGVGGSCAVVYILTNKTNKTITSIYVENYVENAYENLPNMGGILSVNGLNYTDELLRIVLICGGTDVFYGRSTLEKIIIGYSDNSSITWENTY